MMESSNLKKIKDLSGFSGCKISLYKKDKLVFVRKFSKDENYNSRLEKQMQKQILYDKVFATKKIGTPKIFGSGYRNGLFYFDMEYITGETLIERIAKTPDKEIGFIARDLLKILNSFKKHPGKERKNLSKESLKKLDSILQKTKNKKQINLLENLREPLRLLPDINVTFCHGDFTLENIMYDKKNKKYYLIDFLDSFVDHYWFDLAKLFQDFEGGWYAFRNPHLKRNDVNRKVVLMKNKITRKNLYKRNYASYHNRLLALTFSRILPYAHDNDYEYIIDNISKNLSKTKVKKRPNLFFVGNPVSGGEEVVKILSKSNSIFLPRIIEPSYMCKDFHKEEDDFYSGRSIVNKLYKIRDQKSYLDMYSVESNKKIICDPSFSYLYSKVSAEEIKKFNKNSKIVFFLREPIDFLHALHRKMCFRGEPIFDFKEALRLEDKRRSGQKLNGILPPKSYLYYSEWIDYIKNIKRYLKLFPKKNIKIIFYEDLVKNPKNTILELCKFMEIPNISNNEITVTEKKIKHGRILKLVNSGFVSSIEETVKKILPEKVLDFLRKIYFEFMYDKNDEIEYYDDFKKRLRQNQRRKTIEIIHYLKKIDAISNEVALKRMWKVTKN